jgi:hypothetical protein
MHTGKTTDPNLEDLKRKAESVNEIHNALTA